MTAVEIIENLHDRGGRLEFRDGRLLVIAPPSAFDEVLLGLIRRHESEIMQAVLTWVWDEVVVENRAEPGRFDRWHVGRRLDGGATIARHIDSFRRRQNEAK